MDGWHFVLAVMLFLMWGLLADIETGAPEAAWSCHVDKRFSQDELSFKKCVATKIRELDWETTLIYRIFGLGKVKDSP